jgi:hypothetical protein
MTTGNDPYVEHLRGQLSAVLDDVTPRAAPTAAVKRRGKTIRTRRRVGIAAALGVAVVAAALVPGLLRQSKASGPVSHGHPNVTVQPVGRDAPRGLIAQGAIDGKPWRITLRWMGKNLCVGISAKLPDANCGAADAVATAGWPTILEAIGNGATNALYGISAGQVRQVNLVLSDGAVLDLRPVRFARHHWVGVELPAKLAVTRVVAYSRTGELAYAIPFTAVQGGLPSIEDWLRPGQPMPREFTRPIGSGVSAGKRWSVTIHAGPWGQCAVIDIPGDSGGGGCWPPTRQPGLVTGSGGPTDLPWSFVAAVRPKVRYLVLSLTDGTTRRVPTVQVGGLRFYALVIIRGPRIARWSAYDASGHRLYGGQGAPGFGHG